MKCSPTTKKFLMKVTMLSLSVYLGFLPILSERTFAQLTPESLPLTDHVFYIDRDGDSYGVAAPNGPDADDNDPSVTSYESAIAKHGGSLELFLNHLGYTPDRIRYVEASDEEYTLSNLQPGDLVMYKEGAYAGKYVLGVNGVEGTAAKPIVMLAMPGKRVVIQASHQAIGVWEANHIVWDGFEFDGSVNGLAGSKGMDINYSRHIRVKNVYSHHHGSGLRGFQDLHDIVIEDCVIGDHNDTHGIYLGAREHANTNITIRGCRIFRNERHGFQHNGRVSNLLLEGNIIHTNDLGGLSLIEGVSDSVVRNNLIFNNNKQGIVFYDYDDSNTAIVPYDQNNNLIENNLIWGGKYSWNGNNNPTYYAAILFNDGTKAQAISMENNIIRNNILVTHSETVLRFKQQKLFSTTVIENNVLYNVKNHHRIVDVAGSDYDVESLQSHNAIIGGNSSERPDFADVSIKYYQSPEKFDFSLNEESRSGH